VREIPFGTPDGYAIPLGQLATVSLVEGPSTVWREDAIRYVPVKFSVRGRDLAGAVADAQKAVAEKVKLPYGIHIDWSGEAETVAVAVAGSDGEVRSLGMNPESS
jgi:cobalt-zinc-cadmium resistance protein CzcA